MNRHGETVTNKHSPHSASRAVDSLCQISRRHGCSTYIFTTFTVYNCFILLCNYLLVVYFLFSTIDKKFSTTKFRILKTGIIYFDFLSATNSTTAIFILQHDFFMSQKTRLWQVESVCRLTKCMRCLESYYVLVFVAVLFLTSQLWYFITTLSHGFHQII